MNENISKAVDYAFSNNINEMGKEIENALMQKVADALAGKRIEVAQNLMSPEVSESDEEEPFDDFEDEDLEEVDESYIAEKLSVSDGVDVWIDDFVHSDDPRFEGKSKKERIQMALGAFYAAKKGTNEEVEKLDELSTDTLQSYANKAITSKHNNQDAAKSAEAAAFRMKDDRIGDWKSMKSQEDSHNRKVKNRTKGIKTAAKKISKIESDKEKYIKARKW